MSSQEASTYYAEIERIIKGVKQKLDTVGLNLSDFAEELNITGVKLFHAKKHIQARAHFRVSHHLGSLHAYRNLISASM